MRLFKSKTPTGKHLCKNLHFHPSPALAKLCNEFHEIVEEIKIKENDKTSIPLKKQA